MRTNIGISLCWVESHNIGNTLYAFVHFLKPTQIISFIARSTSVPTPLFFEFIPLCSRMIVPLYLRLPLMHANLKLRNLFTRFAWLQLRSEGNALKAIRRSVYNAILPPLATRYLAERKLSFVLISGTLLRKVTYITWKP